METANSTQVQRRTSRADGMENMLVATEQLLRLRPPDEITVRDIAEASGHHHRFVQAWFGGKVGLFRAVFDRIAVQVAGRTAGMFERVGFAEDTKTLARLMNWLVATDPTSLAGERPTPLLDTMTEVYESFGLEHDLARRMAVRMTTSALAMILFQDTLGVRDEDLAGFVELERDLVLLLAADRSGA